MVLFQFSLLYLIMIPLVAGSVNLNEKSGRMKRQLLFPNVTAFQFNLGLTMVIPSDSETINMNLLFQTNFDTPSNWTQLPVGFLTPGVSYISRSYDDDNKNIIDETNNISNDASNSGQTIETDYETNSVDENTYEDYRSKRKATDDYENEELKLHQLYLMAEELLESIGHNGSACVRRTLCEAAAEPLYVDDPDDIVHEIVSYVLNPMPAIEPDNSLDHYKEAYLLGQKNGLCDFHFPECGTSFFYSLTKRHSLEPQLSFEN